MDMIFLLIETSNQPFETEGLSFKELCDLIFQTNNAKGNTEFSTASSNNSDQISNLPEDRPVTFGAHSVPKAGGKYVSRNY